MSNNFSYGYKNFSIDPIAQEVINMISKDPKKDTQSSEQLFQIFKDEFSSKYSSSKSNDSTPTTKNDVSRSCT